MSHSFRSRPFGTLFFGALLCAAAPSAHADAYTQLQLYDGTSYTVGGYFAEANSQASIAAGSAAALASADLSSGILRAAATATIGGTALANTDFRDNVTFASNAAGMAYLDYHWDGTLSALTSDANGAPLSNGFFLITIEGTVGYHIYEYELFNADDTAPCVGRGVQACSYGTSIDQTGAIPFMLEPGVNTIQVDLETSTLDGVTGDFSHTAAIDLQLPDGVTYTSDSGVFLATAVPIGTGPVTPPGGPTGSVPEPAAGLLIAIGLGVLVTMRRGTTPVGVSSAV